MAWLADCKESPGHMAYLSVRMWNDLEDHHLWICKHTCQ